MMHVLILHETVVNIYKACRFAIQLLTVKMEKVFVMRNPRPQNINPPDSKTDF